MNLKCELCKRDISITDFCKAVGVSRATYYKWSTGEHIPSKKHAEIINEFLRSHK